MPIAILTDLFLLDHERTTCDNNHYSKYKEDLKQTEEHNENNENMKIMKINVVENKFF